NGVWRPAGGGAAFWEHDPEGVLVYVGPGHQHTGWGPGKSFPFASSVDYVEALAAHLMEGKAAPGKIYTGTFAVPQSVIFNEAKHALVVGFIDELGPLIAQGKVIPATYSEVVSAWETIYDSAPNRWTIEDFDPESLTGSAVP
ncbi:MAG: hypothetical protein QF464_21260, partial [Myxococcota bacterium]|nr:hypothetical protein [Myxococcota bacterium]